MTIFGQPIVDSKAAGAAVAAPGAGATVVTLGILPAGTYRVSAVVMNIGTAETTMAGLVNIGIHRGTTNVSGLPTTGTPIRQEFERITVNGAESISLKSIAAATAGAVYVGSLSAVRLGG